MNNSKRRETRYFFESSTADNITSILRGVVSLNEIKYSQPVTETVYFTLGRQFGFDFPRGIRVRTRKYVGSLTYNVLMDQSSVILEIKEEIDNGLNCKKQICIGGTDAITLLGNPQGFRGLPRVIPSAATQSTRIHWSLENHGRITLDTDIRLFGFNDNDKPEAEYICDFGEGKLEFKWENECDESLERRLIELTACNMKEYSYLERKTKKCLLTWSGQKQV